MRTGHPSPWHLLGPITASALALGLVMATASSAGPAAAAPATSGTAASLDWHPVPVQEPEGAGSDSLNTGNMTCLSRSDCMVAGYLESLNKVDVSIYHAVVWHWDGRTWGLQATGISGSVSLRSTACTTATDCWALGERYQVPKSLTLSPPPPTALVEHYNGRTWSPLALPGATGVSLNGISCPSASTCVAVGNRQTSTKAAHALAYLWDGKTWSVSAAASPAGALWTVLDSVDCFTAMDCIAVGDADNSVKGSGYFFGERFSGTSWSLFSMPKQVKFNMGDQTYLVLSCPDEHSCLAFGSVLGYTGGQMGADFPGGLSYSWDGGSWASVNIPRGNLGYFFEDGSCTTNAECWGSLGVPSIMGGGLTSAIAVARWDGSSFQITTTTSKGYMSAIGCLPLGTATWCLGLGETTAPGTKKSVRSTIGAGYFVATD